MKKELELVVVEVVEGGGREGEQRRSLVGLEGTEGGTRGWIPGKEPGEGGVEM